MYLKFYDECAGYNRSYWHYYFNIKSITFTRLTYGSVNTEDTLITNVPPDITDNAKIGTMIIKFVDGTVDRVSFWYDAYLCNENGDTVDKFGGGYIKS